MDILVETDAFKTLLRVSHSEKAVRERLPQALRDIMSFAKDRWEKYADSTLSPMTAAFYKRAISQPKIDEKQLSGSVEIDGKFPSMLEEGFEDYDLKPFLLGSKNAETSKSGKKYVDIGFKHLAHDRNNPKSMPKSVYNDMQKAMRRAEKQGSFASGSGTVRGQSYAADKPGHKTGIHSAMLAQVKMTAGGRQATYSTVRRISERTMDERPDSWHHPGFKGVHAAKLVQREVELTLPRLLAQALGTTDKRGNFQPGAIVAFEPKGT